MTTVEPSTTAATIPEAATTAGRVSGAWRGEAATFLGIPFAASPTGSRRFLAPQRPERWDGVRVCDRFGATPQRRPFGPVTTIPEPSIPGDDTLSVNVFTPAPGDTAAALPVLVWVHGGGYFAGSPASPWYDGRSFARDGVVVVTLSYRLGFDGFGWMRDAPLNRGILDQLAALEWVQENIRAFGGDPDRVTIAGQSAGGGSVLTLMTSPRAAGLFRGVVSHSGAAGHLAADTVEPIGRGLAAALGVPPTREGWLDVPEDRILDHERDFTQVPGALAPGAPADRVLAVLADDPMATTGLAFAPVVDGDSVVSVADAVAAGVGGGLSLMLGATRNEFAFPSATPLADIVGAVRAAGVDEAAIARYTTEVERVGDAFADSQLSVVSTFRAPAVHVASRRVAGGAGERTWLYDFAYHSPVDGLSAHCYDLPFAWDLLHADGVERVLGEAAPSALADEMHGRWLEFARTARVPWAPASESVRGAMVFDEHSGFDAEAYAFEAELLAGP
ncbi:carboxylesterase/lipase family protein [Microbacterium sp. 18062]|uniref:carboxylesterase/lipase family protein n=1 Tax=Microbacterium sp. 18062 TaxID=2681410 RepID=UPI001359EBB8|nr:carboxylesterase family protein [Microbacterium sp. 18062]